MDMYEAPPNPTSGRGLPGLLGRACTVVYIELYVPGYFDQDAKTITGPRYQFTRP